jgi:hypothetical protein
MIGREVVPGTNCEDTGRQAELKNIAIWQMPKMIK